MKKLIDNKSLVIDSVTFFLVLLFPLMPSSVREGYMMVLFIAAVLTAISTLFQSRFTFKSDLTIDDNINTFLLIWAKSFILYSLINVEVQATYLDYLLSDIPGLDLYHHKALLGWELMVNFYDYVIFYLPIIASINAVLFLLLISAQTIFKNFNLVVMLKRLMKYLDNKIEELKNLFMNFNSRVLKFIKFNEENESLNYSARSAELFTNDKKAQVPPVLVF